jgi:hypothetical protein
MTVFIVLLVLTMLFAVGAFAAKISQLGVANSGRYRQAAQTHEMAKMGVTNGLAELRRNPAFYVKELLRADLPDPPKECTSVPKGWDGGTAEAEKQNCIRLGYGAFEDVANKETGTTTLQLLERKGLIGGPDWSVPGSLGLSDTHGNFAVELSDLTEVKPPPGGGGGGGSHMKYYMVTVHAVGQVLPTNPDGSPTAPGVIGLKPLVSQEEMRAQVIIGPI